MLLLLGPCAGPSSAQSSLSGDQPGDLPEVLLTVRVNGVDTGSAAVLLRGAGDRLLVRGADLQRWRLRLPELPPRRQDGADFYRLDDIPGLAWRVDEAASALAVNALAQSFDSSSIDMAARAAPRTESTPPGGFFNYDLTTTHASGQQRSGGLFETGIFNRWGVGTATVALRRGQEVGPELLRLDTTWTYDMPDRRASLRLGDAIGGRSQWGLPSRFGGIQWATNFATQPGFVSFPLPTLSGSTALPSTADLLVNDVLRSRIDVPAGPFTLRDLPVVTGQGEARLVVRDLMGQEQVIVAPFLASQRLLKEGLHDFAYEFGWQRQRYGRASQDYGPAVLVGTHRLGWNDRLTTEARVEWSAKRQTAGLGLVSGVPAIGVFNASLAASRSDRSEGLLVGLGVEHQDRRVNWGASVQMASSAFEQVGQDPDRRAARRLVRAYGSTAVGPGSVSIGYVEQRPRDGELVKLLTAGYSVSLGALGFLGFSLVRNIGPGGSTSANLTFTRALDARTSVSAAAYEQRGRWSEQLEAQRNLPAGDGVGWRVRAGGGADRYGEATALVQRSYGRATLGLADHQGDTAVRGTASGALVWMGDSLHAGRRIDGSFALIEVPGMADVPVYADNQLVTRTDAQGRALLPRLRAYQRNPVRIDAVDLPIDAQFDSLQAELVPAYRSGALWRFPVKRSHAATLSASMGEKPVPSGAVAWIDGQAGPFVVGEGGLLYLTGLRDRQQIEVRWGSGPALKVCRFELRLPASTEPEPHLGHHACEPHHP
ncbi:fimbria/pilus outer membrane usher protein [Xylophilus sp. GOD-11R]|uniref:fimbria/pilus outer membrane usher protein n=1 Tax=Xylophilus sp. GOD-11R TaxID=3089814 RepID=UPI00298D3269|nr:fimbria/pilus outer membrane usher protein [Xylophilus sp. GOD-11R]WPB59317.1 fimbria/pilus outer membrane usher protein [Xylophilus sp. GOD-11R]